MSSTPNPRGEATASARPIALGAHGAPDAPAVSASPAAPASPAASAAPASPSGPPRDGWLTTQIDHYVNWGRKNALWPMPFGTACCAIEFMSVVSSHYDLSRFGAEVVRFSPRQSDLLIVAGTVNDKMGPILKQIYDQMPDPKWVIAMGVCASSGGFYRAYHVMQGIDEIIPVDIYVPGCPPTPEGLIHGVLNLQQRIAAGETRSQREMKERGLAEEAQAAAAHAERALAEQRRHHTVDTWGGSRR